MTPQWFFQACILRPVRIISSEDAKICLGESTGLIQNLEGMYVLLFEVYFHFRKKQMHKWCFSKVFGKTQYWKKS